MAIRKSIDHISQANLDALIQNQVGEEHTVEYKRALNVDDDAARREFFRDVSAFANSAGGDIIFGIDTANGYPKGPLKPLSDFDPDQTPLRLRDLCAAHIDPVIRGIQFKAVPLEAGGHALVMRIPQSWDRPHIVKYECCQEVGERNDRSWGTNFRQAPEWPKLLLWPASFSDVWQFVP